jgi:hypothetical protein
VSGRSLTTGESDERSEDGAQAAQAIQDWRARPNLRQAESATLQAAEGTIRSGTTRGQVPDAPEGDDGKEEEVKQWPLIVAEVLAWASITFIFVCVLIVGLG